MNKTGVIIAVIALLVIGGGVFALTSNSDEPTSSTTQSSDQGSPSQNATDTTGDSTDSTNTITYTDDGFSPVSLTVAAGTTITVKNDSSGILQFSSNPHPEHTDEEDLNLKSLSPGKTATFTVSRTGSFGFHNHLNEEHDGTLVVE